MSIFSPSRLGWTLTDWHSAYRSGQLKPDDVFDAIPASDPDNAWISFVSEEQLRAQLEYLQQRLATVGGDITKLPLYGIPFATKDNIDAAGWNTTAACPAFSYTAEKDASVIKHLRDAGAILLGKTNLDQFATGLVGTRSPYGPVSNTFRAEYVSGGSSAGSASVVARGLVPFALGTDTAGSGRVPASFNNIVGLKPTRGWLSTEGVVPACRTLDCVSIFALTADDALSVAASCGAYDAADPYSRHFPAIKHEQPPLTFAIPDKLEFFGDKQAEAAFANTLDGWRAMGAELKPIDFGPFAELAALLYEGPWVAERRVAVETVLARDPSAIQPVLATILAGADKFNAVDTFKYEYKRAALARRINASLAGFTALIVPTTPSIYTIAEVTEDPIQLNSRLGTYTNFTNLADLSALALPAAMRDDGLPAGITLIAPAWHDYQLGQIGKQWQEHISLPLGATQRPLKKSQTPIEQRNATESVVRLAVVGAHLTGMPLNHQLTSRDAQFVEKCRTASTYQLYALANTTPPKPGLVKAMTAGDHIEIELWDVPVQHFGSFVAEIPSPLGIGSLELEDGRVVKGFICEPIGLQGARDITSFGGWRAYLASLK